MHAVDQKLQAREVARIGIKYAVGPISGRADIAMTIKHGKDVTVLEANAWPARRARCRNVERGLGYGLGGRGRERNVTSQCEPSEYRRPDRVQGSRPPLPAWCPRA